MQVHLYEVLPPFHKVRRWGVFRQTQKRFRLTYLPLSERSDHTEIWKQISKQRTTIAAEISSRRALLRPRLAGDLLHPRLAGDILQPRHALLQSRLAGISSSRVSPGSPPATSGLSSSRASPGLSSRCASPASTHAQAPASQVEFLRYIVANCCSQILYLRPISSANRGQPLLPEHGNLQNRTIKIFQLKFQANVQIKQSNVLRTPDISVS